MLCCVSAAAFIDPARSSLNAKLFAYGFVYKMRFKKKKKCGEVLSGAGTSDDPPNVREKKKYYTLK